MLSGLGDQVFRWRDKLTPNTAFPSCPDSTDSLYRKYTCIKLLPWNNNNLLIV